MDPRHVHDVVNEAYAMGRIGPGQLTKYLNHLGYPGGLRSVGGPRYRRRYRGPPLRNSYLKGGGRSGLGLGLGGGLMMGMGFGGGIGGSAGFYGGMAMGGMAMGGGYGGGRSRDFAWYSDDDDDDDFGFFGGP